MIDHKNVLNKTLKLIDKSLNLRLTIRQKSQSIKTYFQKVINQIGQKKYLSLKKVKNRASWTYLSKGINGEDIIGTFNEKERQKAKQTA